MQSKIKAGIMLVVLGLYGAVWAGYNHPEIKWRTIESEHFIFHYCDNTEPLVSPAIAIAEGTYAHLVDLYGAQVFRKLNIALADYDDYSNGWADWLSQSVMIWTPDLFFDLRGNSTWLRNVIAHELTHIVTLRKFSGTQLLLTDLSATVQTPGGVFEVGKTLPGMGFFPAWLAEGLAQCGSSHCSGDCWDSRRDMILRCAMLDHKELSLSQMGNFVYDQLGDEMVYNQGFSLTRYIEQHIGADTMHRFLDDQRSPADFFAFASASPGSSFNDRSISAIYRKWHDSVYKAAKHIAPSDPTPTAVVWRKGRFNHLPRVSLHGRYRGWLTSDGDESDRLDLVITRTESGVPCRVIRHVTTGWDFSPSADAVYYIKSYDPGDHGSFLNELYRCDIMSGDIRQLTKGGRIYAVAVSPAGNEAAVVRFGKGKFSLELLDLRTRSFRVIDSGRTGDPFVSVNYDPADPSRLVVERIVSGCSSLFMVDKNSGKSDALTGMKGQEEAPRWAENGRIYFDADYDGIFNIYSVNADGTGLLRHTSVVGGAFEPEPVPGKDSILFSEYTSSGFGIAGARLLSSRYEPSSWSRCTFFPLQRYQGELSPERPYHPDLLRAQWEAAFAFNVASSSSHDTDLQVIEGDLTIARFQYDMLQKRTFQTGISIVAGADNFSEPVSQPTAFRTLAFRQSGDLLHAKMDSLTKLMPSHPQLRLPPCRLDRFDDVPRSGYAAEIRKDTSFPFAFVIPQARVTYTSLGPTLDGAALCELAYGFLPINLMGQGSSVWQAGRNTIIGTTFNGDWLVAGALESLANSLSDSDVADSNHIPDGELSLSLWYDWQVIGYYNQDLSHNYNDYSWLHFEINPARLPAYTKSDDGSALHFSEVNGIYGRVMGMHGFGITKYSGISTWIASQTSWFSAPIYEPMLDAISLETNVNPLAIELPVSGNTNLYESAEFTALFSFPIARTIDVGRREFFNALYGHIGYDFNVIANRSFFDGLSSSGSNWGAYLRTSNRGIYASQRLIFTADINAISDYEFPGGCSVTAAYDWIRKKIEWGVSARF